MVFYLLSRRPRDSHRIHNSILLATLQTYINNHICQFSDVCIANMRNLEVQFNSITLYDINWYKCRINWFKWLVLDAYLRVSGFIKAKSKVKNSHTDWKTIVRITKIYTYLTMKKANIPISENFHGFTRYHIFNLHEIPQRHL